MFAVVVAFVLMSIRFAAQLALAFAGSASAKAFVAMVGGVILFASLLPFAAFGVTFIGLGITLLLFSVPLFVLIGALTALGFAAHSDGFRDSSFQLFMRGCWMGRCARGDPRS